jgi:hypothetical protein
VSDLRNESVETKMTDARTALIGLSPEQVAETLSTNNMTRHHASEDGSVKLTVSHDPSGMRIEAQAVERWFSTDRDLLLEFVQWLNDDWQERVSWLDDPDAAREAIDEFLPWHKPEGGR